jgi:hypothetical protein
MYLHDRYSLRYQTKYDHKLVLPAEGVPALMLEYLELNIKNDWGWYHENGLGVISFANDKDLTMISLMLNKWEFNLATSY